MKQPRSSIPLWRRSGLKFPSQTQALVPALARESVPQARDENRADDRKGKRDQWPHEKLGALDAGHAALVQRAAHHLRHQCPRQVLRPVKEAGGRSHRLAPAEVHRGRATHHGVRALDEEGDQHQHRRPQPGVAHHAVQEQKADGLPDEGQADDRRPPRTEELVRGVARRQPAQHRGDGHGHRQDLDRGEPPQILAAEVEYAAEVADVIVVDGVAHHADAHRRERDQPGLAPREDLAQHEAQRGRARRLLAGLVTGVEVREARVSGRVLDLGVDRDPHDQQQGGGDEEHVLPGQEEQDEGAQAEGQPAPHLDHDAEDTGERAALADVEPGGVDLDDRQRPEGLEVVVRRPEGSEGRNHRRLAHAIGQEGRLHELTVDPDRASD